MMKLNEKNIINRFRRKKGISTSLVCKNKGNNKTNIIKQYKQ